MNQYTVTLAITLRADSLDDAIEIVSGAGDHLMETFNDDESLVECAVVGELE